LKFSVQGVEDMIIKNIEVEPFIDFLMSFELKGKESRLRTRFVRLLMNRLTLINEEHQLLIKQYSNLDEHGNPKIIEIDGKKFYDVYDKNEFNKEYALLMNEDFVIDETQERKEMLLFIKELILNCDKTFKGREALEYDRWCEIVEAINYDEKAE
jgi:hypothetical protein